ncbi:hypothetical protein, partial [Treponema sp. OMZ 840]|uniref:hypothetical protein n=1 Tax=Treponema sp. OMZ 840 TaxID=244313 RepID=UPI003D90D353
FVKYPVRFLCGKDKKCSICLAVHKPSQKVNITHSTDVRKRIIRNVLNPGTDAGKSCKYPMF